MSRNPHRTRWIGRADVPGRTCHAPGCYEPAATVRAQQLHADLFEPLTRVAAATLIAHHPLTEED